MTGTQVGPINLSAHKATSFKLNLRGSFGDSGQDSELQPLGTIENSISLTRKLLHFSQDGRGVIGFHNIMLAPAARPRSLSASWPLAVSIMMVMSCKAGSLRISRATAFPRVLINGGEHTESFAIVCPRHPGGPGGKRISPGTFPLAVLSSFLCPNSADGHRRCTGNKKEVSAMSLTP